MQQSEEGWCDGLGWADQRPYHWPPLHQWKCHRASVPSAEEPCKLSWGKRKNLLFSSMMEPQLIMKPVLEPGWMESWRTDGWAEGDPYHGQHDLSPLDFWIWGLPEKQSVCKCGDNIGQTKTGNH